MKARAHAHCQTTWSQWALELMQCTSTLPGGSGECNSCNVRPHGLWVVGSGARAMHCKTAQGQSAVELLHCTALVGISYVYKV